MNESITITCPASYHNKVNVIKALRALFNLGLKEAKDASEIIGKPQNFILDRARFQIYPDPMKEIENYCRILKNENVEVSPSYFHLLEELRQLGSQALLMGEDDLANEILQLVLAEKLRKNLHK